MKRIPAAGARRIGILAKITLDRYSKKSSNAL